MFDMRNLSNQALVFLFIVAFASAYSMIVFTMPVAKSTPSMTNAPALVSDTLIIDPNMALYLVPQDVNVRVGDTFVVSVAIENAKEMYGWQVYLRFDPTKLECLGVSVPSNYVFASHETVSNALVNYDHTEFKNPLQGIRNDRGCVLAGDCLLGASQLTFDGSGVLCQIEFKAISSGSSPLRLLHNLDDFQTCIVDIGIQAIASSSVSSLEVTACEPPQ